MRTYLKFIPIIAVSLVTWTASASAADDNREMFAPVPTTAAGPVVDRKVGYALEKLVFWIEHLISGESRIVFVDPEHNQKVDECSCADAWAPSVGVGTLGRGLVVVHDGSYQMMFLSTGQGIIVVDVTPTTGKNILAAISSVTDEPITHVICSHTHKDHIAAASIYPKDAVIIAHRATFEHLRRKNDPDRPVPTKMFTESMTLNLGSQVLKLDYHGLNHSPGNIYIYAPEQTILMLVDVVLPGWAPFKGLAVAEAIDGFLGALDRVLRYDFTHFVGGHLTRRGTREDVEIQKSYVGDIVQAAGKANGAMDFNAAFAKAASRGGKGNPYAFIDVLFDDVAQQCAHEVEKKWKGRLGGVDIFTFGH